MELVDVEERYWHGTWHSVGCPNNLIVSWDCIIRIQSGKHSPLPVHLLLRVFYIRMVNVQAPHQTHRLQTNQKFSTKALFSSSSVSQSLIILATHNWKENCRLRPALENSKKCFCWASDIPLSFKTSSISVPSMSHFSYNHAACFSQWNPPGKGIIHSNILSTSSISPSINALKIILMITCNARVFNLPLLFFRIQFVYPVDCFVYARLLRCMQFEGVDVPYLALSTIAIERWQQQMCKWKRFGIIICTKSLLISKHCTNR